MAAGDLWCSVITPTLYDTAVIASFDLAGNQLFSQTIIETGVNNSDYNYVQEAIIADETGVICNAGRYIYYKSSEDLGFSKVFTGDLVAKCTFLKKLDNDMYAMALSEDTANLYLSTTGASWSLALAYSGFGIIPYIFGAHYDIATSAYYLYRYNNMPPRGYPFREIVKTIDFITIETILDANDIANDFPLSTYIMLANGCLCFYEDHFYFIMYDNDSNYDPRIVKVSKNGVYGYIPFTNSGQTLSRSEIPYYMYSEPIRRLPDGRLFVLLLEDIGEELAATCGCYIFNNDKTAFVRDDVLSGSIYWNSGANVQDARVIQTGVGPMTAVGGQIYDGATGVWVRETVMLSDNSRIYPPPFYQTFQYPNGYTPWSTLTIESGPYVAPENEFWTEERLAIEQSYDY